MTLAIQHCAECGALQYPARDVCRVCLADALEVRETPVTGTVMAHALIHRSLDPTLVRDGPLALGMIAATSGIRLVALLAPGVVAGSTVALGRHPDRPDAILARPLPPDGVTP